MGREPMTLSPAEAAVIRELASGIQGVAELIASTSKDHREWAFEKVERDYLRIMREAGFQEEAAQRWTSSIMRRLQKEVEQRDSIKRKNVLKALHDELKSLASNTSACG